MRESEERRRAGLDLAQTVVLLGALGLIAMPAIKGIARRWRISHPAAAREEAIDESLKETYPASDPPATRYMDIPQNRR